MRRPKIGVIGAGMIGDVHVDRIRRDGRGEVTWLAARTEKTLREKLKTHGIENGTLDYREMLADRKVDAVVIASPPNTHVQMAIDALRAGKHVLLEKPVTVDRKQLRRLSNELPKHPRRVVLECSCRHARLQPKFELVRELIRDGRIGDVYHVHHTHLMRSTFIEYNPKGAWALSKAEAGGGPLFDWGVYDLSFHLGLLGDRPQLSRVRSFTRSGLKVFRDERIRSEVEDHGAAYLEFDGGLTYYWERGSGAHLETTNETRVFGTRGGLRFAYCSWDAPEVEVFDIDGRGRERRKVHKVKMGRHDDNQALAGHFIDCLQRKAKPMMPVPLAAKHLDIIFKVFAAANR